MILNIVAVLIAAFAAWAAWRAAVLLQRTAEAQLYLATRKDYASREMHHALRELRRWHAAHGDNFVEAFRIGYSHDNADAVRVDEARRLVKMHFLNVLRLYEQKFVGKSFLRLMVVEGVLLLRDVIRPIEVALNEGANVYDIDKIVRLSTMEAEEVAREMNRESPKVTHNLTQ